jgi:hypothetical protein
VHPVVEDDDRDVVGVPGCRLVDELRVTVRLAGWSSTSGPTSGAPTNGSNDTYRSFGSSSRQWAAVRNTFGATSVPEQIRYLSPVSGS